MPTCVITKEDDKRPRFCEQIIRFGKLLDPECLFLTDNGSPSNDTFKYINSIASYTDSNWDIFIVYNSYILPILQHLELFSIYNRVRLNIIVNELEECIGTNTILKISEYWKGRIHSLIYYNPWREPLVSEREFIKQILDTNLIHLGYIPHIETKKNIPAPDPAHNQDIISGYIGENTSDALVSIMRLMNTHKGRKIYYINPETINKFKHIIGGYGIECVIKPGISILDYIISQKFAPSIYLEMSPKPLETTELEYKLIDEMETCRSSGYEVYHNVKIFNRSSFISSYEYQKSASPLPMSHHERIRNWTMSQLTMVPLAHKDRGICICAGGENYICELIVALQSLHSHGVGNIPISIIHAGDELTTKQQSCIQEVIKPLELNLSFLDINPLIENYRQLINEFCSIEQNNIWSPRGFQIKQWAIIFAPYNHAIIMDTDIIACTPIPQWFNDIPDKGITLWKDYWRTNRHPYKSADYCREQFSGIKQSIDRREWIYPLYNSYTSEIDNESGLMFVNRGSLINMERFICMTIAYGYFNRYFYGDKDLYNLAFPVKQMNVFPGAIVMREDNLLLIGMCQYSDSQIIHHLHFTLKPVRGNDTASLPARESMGIVQLKETDNLIPIVKNSALEFSVSCDVIEDISQDIYDDLNKGYELSREYYLLSLF